jgi:hypothetical protein
LYSPETPSRLSSLQQIFFEAIQQKLIIRKKKVGDEKNVKILMKKCKQFKNDKVKIK